MTSPAVSRAQELAYQRLKLRAKCAAQRQQLGASLASVESELAGVDRAVAIARRFATKPAIVAAGVALLTVIGPRRALRWVTQSAFWYTTGSRLVRSLLGHSTDHTAPSLLHRVSDAIQRLRVRRH